uniref:Glycosyltransferase n=1 Tax=viral metagenome TaxID=1070528 RepID=A0A6H1Z963_9ZZZZ
MNICILGWYYDLDFMRVLEAIHPKYPVHIVGHRPNAVSPLPTTVIENVGLEFGGYDYYLKNLWDGINPVFFTHDDTLVTDMVVFDKIAKIDKDFSFIFYNNRESLSCMGAHGRAFYCSPRFLEHIKSHPCKCDMEPKNHTGFYFDPANKGKVTVDGETIMDYTAICDGDSYNKGIKHLYFQLHTLKGNNYLMDKPWKFGEDILPDYQYGYRGLVGIEALIGEVNNLITQDSNKIKRLYRPL